MAWGEGVMGWGIEESKGAATYNVAMKKIRMFVGLWLLGVGAMAVGVAQEAPQPAPPYEISADQGSCSVQLRVTGRDGRPLYGARVTTRVSYGLFGVKHVDLEALTDQKGEIRITRLPSLMKKPMLIHIAKGEMDRVIEYNPEQNCQARFDVQLP